MKPVPITQSSSLSDEQKRLLKTIEQKMGSVPNIFRHMIHSPLALEGYLNFSEIASKMSLSPLLQEKIALTVAEKNGCFYCLSAHSAIARMKGITDNEILHNRAGRSSDKRESHILRFVQKMVETKGHLPKEDLERLNQQGVSSQEIVEIIFVVIINMFTNYFNNIVEPEIDFPVVQKEVEKN